MSRISRKLVVIILIVTSFSFFAFHATTDINHRDHSYGKDKYDYEIKINKEPQFTIKTDGCSIPALAPISESIKKFVNYPQNGPVCLNSSLLLLDRNKTHIWLKQSISDGDVSSNCCYRSFYRPLYIDNIEKDVDNRYEYNECIYFTDVIEAKHEFVNVVCDAHTDGIEEFFVFAPSKKFRKRVKKQLSKNSPAYNVLVLGIDSVSRLNFYRTMPKTIEFLKRKNVMDFMGYNKVGDNTFPNLIPMLMGISSDEIRSTCLPFEDANFDNCPFIWEWYKQAGYYTAFGEDSSWLGTFNYVRRGFWDTPTDYYFHTFINVFEKYASRQNNKTGYQLCLNDKYSYKVLLDYVEDLTDALKSSKLFGFFWETTITHDNLNYPMLIDEDYLRFFQRLDSSGYLNETILFLVSDHGIRWGRLRETKQGRIEERLPFLLVLVPPSFRKRYETAYNNLERNQRYLITPYDVYATLYDLIDLNKITNENIKIRSERSYARNRSISLFFPVPGNRTCEAAGISDHWCSCHRSVSISKYSKKVKRYASHLNYYLYTILKDYKQCANLTIVEIIEAFEMLVGKPDNEERNSWRDYMLVVRTEPGNGTFEATVRTDGHKWEIPGTVSRINLYGNQSYCIDNNLLKLYCYCV